MDNIKADFFKAGVMPFPRWIPVSERLPEEQQIVVTYQKWGEYKLNHIIDGTEWYWDGVVAWMPIEPYREEADNADANGG